MKIRKKIIIDIPEKSIKKPRKKSVRPSIVFKDKKKESKNNPPENE